jgi:hypothetical protein
MLRKVGSFPVSGVKAMSRNLRLGQTGRELESEPFLPCVVSRTPALPGMRFDLAADEKMVLDPHLYCNLTESTIKTK